MFGSVFDESRYFLGVRDVDSVAGSFRLDFMAVCAFGIHPLQVGIYHLVVFSYQVPTRFDLPGGVTYSVRLREPAV